MSRRLKENISSSYLEAANRLNSKNARKKIIAYVESYDDVFFWRSVLSELEDETRYFEVMLPSKFNLTKGKKSVLMNLLSSRVGSNMIACVDADYDYLMQGITPVSKEILTNPYVFHTYVYAIENYQCYAPALHDVCVMITLNDHSIFDFEDYFKRYSEAIYPLFLWNIWVYRHNIYGQFTISDFNNMIEVGHFNMHDPYYPLSMMRTKVSRKVAQFERHYPQAKADIDSLKNELEQLGVTPENTYLYIQGHHLFDTVVSPMLSLVCDRLFRERQNEIYQKAVHNTQMRNELSCYNHSVEDVIPMLKRNVGYSNSEPFKRLREDLQNFLNSDKEESHQKV